MAALMRLDDYLADAQRKPWAWGRMDCTLFAGDWVRAATGIDPCVWRGTYSNAYQARRLLARHGGFMAMVEREMSRCGFARIDAPEHGDVAIIEAPGTQPEHAVAGMAAVIVTPPWLLARAPDGIVGLQAEIVAAWRVK